MVSLNHQHIITTALPATVAAVGLAGAALFYVFRAQTSQSSQGLRKKFIASPLTSLLPSLSKSQIDKLPYPPDFFPGPRDVSTPYGNTRVYEWGPETGRKVVMVPGDSTPAPVYAVVARALVERGCRVLVLDTWGRGYSDSPLNVTHDARLFELQILFAVSSSPLSWTGSSQFSIIGFSLGGGITMSFACHFPNLIESIILLGPVGLLRRLPDSYRSPYIRHHQWFSASILRRTVANTVGVNLRKQPISTAESSTSTRQAPENPDLPALSQWQFDEHEGFVHSFVDTVQNGSIQYQHDDFQQASDIICGKDTDSSSMHSKLRNSRVLIICGDNDSVVPAGETLEDWSKLLPGHIDFKTVPGDHGFPIPSGQAVVQHICDFWND